MAIDISRKQRDTYLQEDQRWLKGGILHAPADSILLDRDAFDLDNVFTDGFIPSGVVLGKITANGLYGPYGGTTDEVQTLTIDATGGTYTLTFDGDTTDAIDFDATAAEVQTELEGLDGIGEGDVTVAGSDGGPYTISFVGDLADTNVDAITTDAGNLTGGDGTAVIDTTTAGGAEGGSGGLETAAGLLLTSAPYDRDSDGDIGGALAVRCDVITNYLPDDSGFDANAQAELEPHMRFFTYNHLA